MLKLPKLPKLTPKLRQELRQEVGRQALSVAIAWLLVSLISFVYAALSTMITGYWSITLTMVLAVSIGAFLVILVLSAGLAVLAYWVSHANMQREEEKTDE